MAFGNSYNDEERCVLAGYDNGDVKLFDLRTGTVRYETNVKNGVRVGQCVYKIKIIIIRCAKIFMYLYVFIIYQY